MADRQAILVLGMHRSGTSALARVLNMLGATLPRRLTPEAAIHPVGQFEPVDIVTIHEQLLRSAGTRWSDWSRFPDGWYDSPSRDLFVDELARAVRENYGDSDLFVVKDPRMARLVPVWRDVLSTLGIAPIAVVPYRNPLEVALSLRRHDRFTLGQSLLLWLRHCLDAEAETRGLPRCFVSYERLVGESQMTAYKIMEALPIAWPRKTAQAVSEISGFLDPRLHRQTVPPAGLQHPDVNEAVSETYANLGRLERDEADGVARARLDGLRSDLDITASMTFAAFEDLAAERRRLDGDLATLGKRVEQLTAELARLTTARDAADADRSVEVEGLRLDVATLAATWQASQASSDAELDAVGERLRRLTGRVAREAFEAESASRSWSRRSRPRPAREGEAKESLRGFVLSSGLFDAEWYRARHGEAVPSIEDALGHYLSVGFDKNYDPGPAFDAAWYLEANPDVRQAGIPPLVHYVQSGIAEGRRGRPKSAAAARSGTGESTHES